MSQDHGTQDHEPLTPLTPAEVDFIDNTVSRMTRDEVLARLKRDVQTAVQIELATIPIYLFTYYSIVRNKRSGENIKQSDLFANKAGSLIMSVAVEEMLHLSLSSNVYFALFGEAPAIYGQSPAKYPTQLPHHKLVYKEGPEGKKDAKVEIPLGPLSFEQLWHFLQIEYPEGADAAPRDDDWDTIGQFYSYIRCLLHSSHLSDRDFQNGPATYQIQPYNYSPNNVDTICPETKFDAWKTPGEQGSASSVATYPNADDSHAGATQLVTVSSIRNALEAIDTVCDQGEGANHSKWDDLNQAELSHYYKFLNVHAQFENYGNPDNKEQLPDEPPKPPAVIQPAVTTKQLITDGVVIRFQENPTTAGYPEDLRPYSDFCNGLYQYMLIMTETIFRVYADPGEPAEKQAQKKYFNESMHRSMIWVLDKFSAVMRQMPLDDSADPVYLAPTFEFVNLGDRSNGYKDAFDRLATLGEAAIAAAAPKAQKKIYPFTEVAYYVGIATGAGGQNLHLPDVGRFYQD